MPLIEANIENIEKLLNSLANIEIKKSQYNYWVENKKKKEIKKKDNKESHETRGKI